MCLLIHIVVGPPPFSSENTALVLDAEAKHNTTKQHLVTALACYQTLLSDNSDGAVDDGTGLLSNLTLRQQWKSSWWQRWLVVKPYSQTIFTEQLVTALACCQTLFSDNSERAVGDSTGLLWSLIPDKNEREVEKGHRHIMWHHFQTSVTEQWVTEQLCRVASFWENSDRAAGSITGMMCSFIFRWQQ